MKLRCINKRWWIIGVPNTIGEPPTDCGPYDSRAEAAEDRDGLRRFCESNPRLLNERPADDVLVLK